MKCAMSYCDSDGIESHSMGLICKKCVSAEYSTTCPSCGHEFLVN